MRRDAASIPAVPVRGVLVAAILAAISLLAGAAAAEAAPVLSLSAGFPAGSFLAEPTTATAAIELSGSQYDARLSRLTLRFPPGTVLSTAGLPGCPKSELEPSGKGPKACARSLIGPDGSFSAWAAFGRGLEPEQGTVETFLSTEGGILLFLFGHEPVLVEELAVGHLLPPAGSLGPSVSFEVPTDETVPGAPPVSLRDLSFELGPVAEQTAQKRSVVTAPAQCTTSLPWQVEAQFTTGEGAVVGTTTATSSPCLAESPAQRAAEVAREASERAERAFARAARLLPSWLSPPSRRIDTLLAHDGYTSRPPLPEGTSLSVAWHLIQRGHRAPPLIATGAASAAGSGPATLTVRLTRAGRKLLEHRRSLPIAASAQLIGAGSKTSTGARSFRVSRTGR